MPTEGFEQEPSPCRPVIEIDDPRKDAIVAGMKGLFELSDLLGLFLDQSADNRVLVAERPNAKQPQGPACEDGCVSAHEFSRFHRP